MSNYIDNSEHKSAIRCIQLLAYICLVGVLTVVVLFVIHSLDDHTAKDSRVFFVVMLISLTGSALHCAVGISLPHAGKFRYFKIPVHAFIITDIIGLAHGLRCVTARGKEFGYLMPYLFYTMFYLGCLVCNILILRFLTGLVSRRAGTIASIIIMILLLLHISDITYCLIFPDAFPDAETNKNNLIRLSSNIVFLFTAVSSLIVTRIKPKESEQPHDDPLRSQ